MLACWRTKPDPNNPLSSFNRSLPFSRLLSLYEDWHQQLEQSEAVIKDMSDYSAEESAALQAKFPRVQLVRESIRTLHDTLTWFRQCSTIVSVDTSLTHLAAVCGRDAHLLLPLYPDERWLELLTEHSVYATHVRVHQQSDFHNWDAALASLTSDLTTFFRSP